MMLLLRIVSQGPSTEKPPRWTMPCTPVTARSTSAIDEVGLDEGFVGRKVAGRLDVAQAEVWIDALEEACATVPMAPAAPVTRTVSIMLSLPTFYGVTRIAKLCRESLISLAAVEHMPPHCCASLRHGACADRTHDCAMFLLEHLAVGSPG